MLLSLRENPKNDTERIDKETGDLDKVLDCIELEDRQVLSMADFAFL